MVNNLRGSVTEDTCVCGILKIAAFFEEICESEEFILPSKPAKECNFAKASYLPELVIKWAVSTAINKELVEGFNRE